MTPALANRRVARFIGRIDCIIQIARCRQSHAWMINEINEALKDPTFGKLPVWARQKVYAHKENELKVIYHRDVMWLFPPSDGGLPMPMDSLSREDYDKVIRDELRGAYFWMKKTTVKNADGSIIDTWQPTAVRY